MPLLFNDFFRKKLAPGATWRATAAAE
jgi:hypothetical protein